MKLAVYVVSFLTFLGSDHQQSKLIEEEDKAKTDSLENVISVYAKNAHTQSVPEPCKETPCDSAGYYKKGIAEGLRGKEAEMRKAYLLGTKTCPVCVCDTTPPMFLDYEIKGDSIFVKTTKGSVKGKVHHKVGVKPVDQK